MSIQILEKNEFGYYTEDALEQLEREGLANIVSNNVYYFNEDADAFIFCDSNEDCHRAVLSVLKNLGYDIEE